MNGTYRSGVNLLDGLSGISQVTLDQIRSSIQGAHIVALKLGTGLAGTVIQTSSQAFVNGMREALLIASVVMWIAAVTAWLILPAKNKFHAVNPVQTVEEHPNL